MFGSGVGFNIRENVYQLPKLQKRKVKLVERTRTMRTSSLVPVKDGSTVLDRVIRASFETGYVLMLPIHPAGAPIKGFGGIHQVPRTW